MAGLGPPLEILPSERHDGLYRVASDRGRAAGLVNRPLVDTASEVLQWDRRREQKPLRLKRGVSPKREASLLGILGRGADSIGARGEGRSGPNGNRNPRRQANGTCLPPRPRDRR